MFDSSVTRGEPATFPLDQRHQGLDRRPAADDRRREAAPLDSRRSSRTSGRPARPRACWCSTSSCSTILKTPKTAGRRRGRAAPPRTPTKTASGLAYKVLKKGTGKEHPTATSAVKVHYSGWTTDGKMFDSSVTRGEPATFPLDGVIPGWTEGVQLMVEGEKRRFWIPEALAYKGQAGRSCGHAGVRRGAAQDREVTRRRAPGRASRRRARCASKRQVRAVPRAITILPERTTSRTSYGREQAHHAVELLALAVHAQHHGLGAVVDDLGLEVLGDLQRCRCGSRAAPPA